MFWHSMLMIACEQTKLQAVVLVDYFIKGPFRFNSQEVCIIKLPFRVNSQEVVRAPSPILLKLSLPHLMNICKI